MPGPVERPTKVLIIAPVPPPYGGMALQAGLLAKLLRQDGVGAEVLGYNRPFHPRLHFLERIPAVRTALRTVVFIARAWRLASDSSVIHILACSWLYFFSIVAPAVVIGRVRGKHVVLNYRGGDADHFLKQCGWLVRPVFQAATSVTAPSAFLAQVIERRLAMAVSIVPNIVDLSAFSFRARTKFQAKMLVTRHLLELYGIETVLRAFRRIQQNYPDASLWIAGTGQQEAYLRGLISEWGLANVLFLGYIDRAGLPKVYDECDILLNGSRVDNFPASLVEASASGLVVISTKAGGIPFIYENGKTALLVEIDDWEGMAAAVIRVLEHDELARQLTSAARHLAQRCDWGNVRTHIYSTYRPSRDAIQSKPAKPLAVHSKD